MLCPNLMAMYWEGVPLTKRINLTKTFEYEKLLLEPTQNRISSVKCCEHFKKNINQTTDIYQEHFQIKLPRTLLL